MFLLFWGKISELPLSFQNNFVGSNHRAYFDLHGLVIQSVHPNPKCFPLDKQNHMIFKYDTK